MTCNIACHVAHAVNAQIVTCQPEYGGWSCLAARRGACLYVTYRRARVVAVRIPTLYCPSVIIRGGGSGKAQ